VTADSELLENLRFFITDGQKGDGEEDGITLNPAMTMNARKFFEILSKGATIPVGIQALR